MKKYIAENEIKFYTINATDIAAEIGLGNRINMIMQSAFFKLADVIPMADAEKYLKDSIDKAYGKKGQKILDMNYAAVDKGAEALHKVEVPAAWANVTAESIIIKNEDEPDFIKNILRPVNAQAGDDLPVSAFVGAEDGHMPHGSAAFEKRGIAVNVPEWQAENLYPM